MVLLGYYIYYLKNQEKSPIVPSQNVKTDDKKELTKQKTAEMSFIIGGDVMLGRAVAYKFNNDVSQAFENLGEGFFTNHDLGIINLEGPISATDFPANPNPNNLIFNFPPQTVDALNFLGVNAVSMSNNHSRNQGKSGLEETQNLLKEKNIVPIGEQLNFGLERFGDDKKKLSVITINMLEDDSDITATIKEEKQAGNFVIIFPHWGSEYQETHNGTQEAAAHSWIDAGADAVFGSHPHVVQDAEIYQEKPIFYSLGNLIFDQTFSQETQQGLILVGKITAEKLSLQILPTVQRNLQVELTTGEKKQEIIKKIKTDLGLDSSDLENDVVELNLK